MKKKYKVIVQFRDKNEDRLVKVGEILELESSRASEILGVGGFIRPATDEDLENAKKVSKKVESDDEAAEENTEKESDDTEASPKASKKEHKKGKK